MTTMKIALVTGANKGIGLEIVRQLAQAGVTTLLGARDAQRGAAAVQSLAADGLDVSMLQLDVGDPTSIAAAARSVEQQHDRLDILVNNAGIWNWTDGPPSSAGLDAVREELETNFVGTLAVTQAMLRLLGRSPAGRIVNMSSALGSLSINGDPTSPYYDARLIGYNASKAAVNMLTVQLNAELRAASSSITVNSVSPGYVQTDLTHGRGMLTPAEAAALPVRYALSEDPSLTGGFFDADGPEPW